MEASRLALCGLLFVLLQACSAVQEDDPSCVPGFQSDVLVFRVFRETLHTGTRLGKVGFSDCTQRTVFPFSSDNSYFTVTADGTLKVKKPTTIRGSREFLIHTWDSNGRKVSVPVRVEHHGDRHHGDRHHGDRHHGDRHHGDRHHGDRHQEHAAQNHENQENRQHHHVDVAGNTEPAEVVYFPKRTEGLRRRKRDWVIPDLKVSENDRGPYPLKVSQIRSNEDKVKKILYSITGPGASEDPVGLFTMDRHTGNLYLTQPLDREVKDQYKFQAHALVDGAITAEEPMDIVVHVIDQNDNKPVFTKDTFLGEVAEASSIGTEVIQVNATDADQSGTDNADIRYRIISQEPTEPSDFLFVINPVTGGIRVNAGGLDREKHPKYVLEVQVADMRGEGLTGFAKVILTVTDSNDNAPAYTLPSYATAVDENKAGVQILVMSVTDGDEPHSPAWNAKFHIVHGDPAGFFTVKTGTNKHEGILSTAKGLDFEKSQTHTLLIAVVNEIPFAVTLPTATATVVVTVSDVNEAPVFDPQEKVVVKPENLEVNSNVVQYTASDPDTARKQTVMYRMIRDPAGWLSVAKDTGVIRVKSEMDRESLFVKDNKYTALIGAYDNDDIPATGTGTLIIQLEDVNDNAPTIEQRVIKVCNRESAPQLLSVTDRDGPGFTAPYSVSLMGASKNNWTARMNESSRLPLYCPQPITELRLGPGSTTNHSAPSGPRLYDQSQSSVWGPALRPITELRLGPDSTTNHRAPSGAGLYDQSQSSVWGPALRPITELRLGPGSTTNHRAPSGARLYDQSQRSVLTSGNYRVEKSFGFQDVDHFLYFLKTSN